MNNTPEKNEIQVRLERALSLPEDKKFYFNGFTISITPSDVLISLESTHQTIALLQTPHYVAKTLVEKLNNVITKFEKDSDYTFPTLQEMEELVKNLNDKSE
jgi:hypothetical protein